MNGITFRHPSSWRVHPAFSYSFSFDDLLTELSNQPIHDPCTIRTAQEMTCGSPPDPLQPGGIVLTWTQSSFPHPAGSDWATGVPGTRAVVAGLEARVSSGDAQAWCAADSGARQIVVTLHRDGGRVIMTACMAAPGTAVMEATVNAMVTALVVTG